jgi:hypothetical protein
VLKSRTSDGALFLSFSFWIDEDDAEGRTVRLRLEEKDKYWTMIEAKTLWFSDSCLFIFQLGLLLRILGEECLKIQVVMVLLIRLHELHCAEVDEQNIRCECVSKDFKMEMMEGSSWSLGLAIVGYLSQV